METNLLTWAACNEDSMRELGRGWEYRVYDLGKGRVLKIPRTIPDQVCRIASWSVMQRRLPSWREVWLQARRKQVSEVKLREIVRVISTRSFEALCLVGNPEVLADGRYTQEQVTPVADYVRTHSQRECRAIISRYAGLVVELWGLGLGDCGFNVFMNCGVRSDESVMQMDITSLTQDVVEIQRSINRRAWNGWTLWHDWPDDKTRSEWLSHADRHFSLGTFQKAWREAMDHKSRL